MRLTPGSLLLMLLVSSLSPVQGILEAHNTSLKCKCRKTTSDSVYFRTIEQLQIFPPGNGCPFEEIIVVTKNKSHICLNPQSKWMKTVRKRIMKLFASSTQ